jgi:hypothetical protein
VGQHQRNQTRIAMRSARARKGVNEIGATFRQFIR